MSAERDLIASIEQCPAGENPSCSYADGWNECISYIRARLAAIPPEPASVPEGWQLVPKDATHEMKKAAIEVEIGDEVIIAMTFEEATKLYRAMLAAAPQAEQPAQALTDELIRSVLFELIGQTDEWMSMETFLRKFAYAIEARVKGGARWR